MRWSLILVVIAAVPFLFARFSAVNWDNAIGELSYPVYLIHMLVISAMRSALHLNNTILTCLATVAVGLVLVRYVEEPMNRYRQYRHRKAIQGPRVSSRAEPIGDVASSQSELVNGVE